MTLVIDRTDIDTRFRDVRVLVSLIKSMESDSVPPTDVDAVKILRGLFYVHLYGGFEKSVNDIVQAYLRRLGTLGIRKAHARPQFWPAALDSNFKSLQATIGDGNWKRRSDFVSATESSDVCVISEAIFGDRLQNVRYETVDFIFMGLGLGLMDWNGLNYLAVNEVVDKRNQVAHGRTPPVRVGSTVRSMELEGRLDALSLIVNSIADQMERHMDTLLFVRDNYREAYRAPA